MTTVRRHPQGTRTGTETTTAGSLLAALIGAALALLWRAVSTSPALLLILCGALLSAAEHPWIGAAVAIVGALIYRTQCYRTPYARCGRCRGTGHRLPRRRRARVARRCWLCRGKGVRMRWGRRAMNAWRRVTYTPPTDPADALDARPARAAGPVVYAEAFRDIQDYPRRWPVRTTESGREHDGPRP